MLKNVYHVFFVAFRVDGSDDVVKQIEVFMEYALREFVFFPFSKLIFFYIYIRSFTSLFYFFFHVFFGIVYF